MLRSHLAIYFLEALSMAVNAANRSSGILTLVIAALVILALKLDWQVSCKDLGLIFEVNVVPNVIGRLSDKSDFIRQRRGPKNNIATYRTHIWGLGRRLSLPHPPHQWHSPRASWQVTEDAIVALPFPRPFQSASQHSHMFVV